MAKRVPRDILDLQTAGYCVKTEDARKINVTIPTPADSPFGEVKLEITFAENHPFSPPAIRIQNIWHPNIYPDGRMCASFLHERTPSGPGEDESISEKWSPAIRSPTLMSMVLNILLEPNVNSPANPSAAVMLRTKPDEYRKKNEALKKRRQETAEREKVKEEQEEAFKAAQIKDEKKELSEKKEKNKRLEEEAEQAESHIKAELEVQRAEAALPEEPPEDASREILSLRFRTPSGLLTRRFFATDSLQLMMQFLMSKRFHPKMYRVVRNHPRKDLSSLDTKSSLAELQLCRKEILTVEERQDTQQEQACPLCPDTFPSPTLLQSHFASVHPDLSPAPAPSSPV